MRCDPLPNTGVDAPVAIVLAAAIVFLLLGLGLLLRARKSPARAGATLLLVILALGAAVLLTTPTTPAFAAPADCNHPRPGYTTTSAQTTDPAPTVAPSEITESAIEPENSLTITQTSTMDDLAPNVAPVEITGLVENNGPDSTFITAIAVEIIGVERRAGSAAGTCDASDYILLDTRMFVGQTLEPYGGSAVFAGAAIGFNNKSTNQDACQGATIELHYRTSA